eukprot:gnl/TRDRNA2_/TRDRNA2_158452_c2_seq1.p1 gnl/TRDRNA2_/TRDRNA2_158452_c2~~gnl/TRDRNA2_/TRDRNA2_158452_c2_seq1.p1  ORF type:complete len:247 (+),score=35.87 gnl/TRDRNA2_/TRDRNA2_158452_c2_seq1:720-1460(+)
MLRFLLLCSVALLRSFAGECAMWVLMLGGSATFLAVPTLREHRGLEKLSWLGFVLGIRRLIRAVPRSRLPGPNMAAALGFGGWLASAWLNSDIIFGSAKQRGPVGNFPLIIGICLLLEVAKPSGTASAPFSAGHWCVWSRLSFGMLLVHRSLLLFVEEALNDGQPLVQGTMFAQVRDPFLHLFFVGPGLVIWLTLCAAVAFVFVQRPARIILGSLLNAVPSQVGAHFVAPVYVAYFVAMQCSRGWA